MPRTVAEFAAVGLSVSLSCGSCQRVQAVPPDVLDATFGPDFDLVAGQGQITSQLYCPHCGASRPRVVLEDVAAAVAERIPVRRRAAG
jgi:hypothetical protein